MKRVILAGTRSVEPANREHARFDLVLVDISELDGRDFHREIERRHPALTRRLVFMTGDALSPETTNFLARTKAPVLVRPFALAELPPLARRHVHREGCPS